MISPYSCLERSGRAASSAQERRESSWRAGKRYGHDTSTRAFERWHAAIKAKNSLTHQAAEMATRIGRARRDALQKLKVSRVDHVVSGRLSLTGVVCVMAGESSHGLEELDEVSTARNAVVWC